MRIRLALSEVLGPELAAACEDLELRGGTVIISTSNPALAHQLRLDSAALLARLNGLNAGRRLRELKLRTGGARVRPSTSDHR